MRQNWQMWQGRIPPEECDDLVERLRVIPPVVAQTFNHQGGVSNNDLRKSNVRWVEDLDVKAMLFWYAKEANRNAFGFDVTDCGSVQFTEYSSDYRGKYDVHHDIDWNGQALFDRKISVVVQLSDPRYYEGCDFRFSETENPDANALKEKGTILCFPSYLRHGVTEITKGTRYSLVAWFEGPRWR